jgi:glycosyltransferase involved in cell wall biosynthesis
MTPAAQVLHSPASVLAPEQQAELDLTIFISCYKEEAFIVSTIETVRAALAEVGTLSYEIIIIDDCSGDRSADLVAEYIKNNPNERILLRRNRMNLGWAQNFIDAAFIGKGRYYRVICGDASEPRSTMVKVFGEIGTADLIIPYYVRNEGRGWHRSALSSAYAGLINFVSGYKLHYYNGLPVHLRYNVMRWHSNTRGFGFQADIICMLLEQGFTYKEVPVVAIEKKGGKSTALTFKNLISVAHTVFDIAVRRLSNAMYRD